MHRLFGELLRVHARRELGDELGELHRRAALWYAAAGEPADALRHAAAGADWDLTANLVATHWLELSARSGREVPARDPGAGAAGAPRRRPPLAAVLACLELEAGEAEDARAPSGPRRGRRRLAAAHHDTLAIARLRAAHADGRLDRALEFAGALLDDSGPP